MDSLRRYLRGEFKPEIFHEVHEIFLKTKLMVFVSSTFTDTHLERDLLHKTILPLLQQQALRDYIEVILYDMRFGVKDENTKDHMTWPICKDGIGQCNEESDGMFFLSLQGNKYGYRSLPKYVDKEDMAKAFSRLEDQPELLAKLSKLFEEWFELDENHVPARYELRALQSLDNKYFYNEVLPSLRDELLQSASFEHQHIQPTSLEYPSSLEHDQSTTSLDARQHSTLFEPEEQHSSDLVVGRSVTEWETLFALALDENGGRCHWIRRFFDRQSLLQFKERPADYCLLTDVMDNQARSLKLKLEILKRKMKSILFLKNGVTKLDDRISADNYLAMTKDSSKSFEDIASYLNSWKVITLNLLSNELTRMVDHNTKFMSFLQDSFNISLEYFEEISHHNSLWKKKCSVFIGREALLEEALNLLNIPVENHESSVNLALIGKSGTGKTGLMSMMAKMVSESQSVNSIPVIIRYCGTSQYSLHGIDLIQSICIQLIMIYEDKDSLEDFMKWINSMSYEDLIDYFHRLLAEYPVYLFIDSLDQLSNRNEARSKLHFLMSNSVHELSKIIVSALPDEKNETDNTFQYLYFCEERLKQFHVPILNIEPLTTNEEEIKGLIMALMRRRQRTFSISQWDCIWKSVVEEPTTLYVNLAVEIIHRWRSFDQNMSLTGTVKGIIDQLFSGLEIEYGPSFTRMCFAFITYSREGVNDTEMKDCLSLSEEVLQEVFQYSKLESFPMHVWLRLKFVLKNLVTEKESHCIKWHHRQIWERAEDRYSSLKNKAHEIMGRYFGNLIDEREGQQREMHKQPLTLNGTVIWLPSSKVNIRRVKEGYYHLVEANMNEEAIKEMCSLEMVCATGLLDDGYNFIAYLGKLSTRCLESKESSTKLHERLDYYYRWVRKEMSTIAANPRVGISLTATREPMISVVYQEACKVPNMFATGTFASDDIVWCQNTVSYQRFDGVIMNLRGHTSEVVSVSWNHDGSMIASGCKGSESVDSTIKLWDTTTGHVVNTLEGHSDGVYSVSWNRDGSKIASGSGDNTIKIWDAFTSQVLHTLEGHSDGVTSVSWNHDGTKIASGSFDSSIKVWEANTGQVMLTLNVDSWVSSISWNPEGSKIVFGSYDCTFKFWDLITGLLVDKFAGHSYAVTSVSWNLDCARIASGSSEKTIKIWNVITGDSVESLEGHTDDVNSIAWYSETDTVASGSKDNTIRIWDVGTGLVVNILNGHSGSVNSVQWHRDGSKLASGSADKTIKIWGVITGEVLNTLEGHSAAVTSVLWNFDGSKLASGSDDKAIKIWDATTGEVLNTLEGHSGPVTSVSWNPDGSKVASGSDDKAIKIWNVVTGEVLNTLEGHSGRVTSVSWTPDGTKIASGSHDCTIKVWDASTGQLLNTLEMDSSSVSSVSWNCYGDCILFGTYDSNIKIWQPTAGQPVNKFAGHSYVVYSVSWSPDGDKIASGSSDKRIKIWDAKTGELVKSLEGHSDKVNSLSWNRDGSRISSGSKDKTMKIWDAATGYLVNTLTGHSESVNSVHWHHDGNKVAPGSADRTIKIWDATTEQLVNAVKGHSAAVTSVSWNPDGTKIASSSDDKTIKIWDVVTRQVVNTLEGHLSGVTSVSWNRDGTKLASVSKDKTIRIWDATTGRAVHTMAGCSVGYWSPDGSKIAGKSEYDKILKIWDVITGLVVNTLKEHSEGVSWSPDGSKIAGGPVFDYNMIKIWDVITGQVMNTLKGHSDNLRSVSWNSDGSKIASTAIDSTIKIWDAITGQVLHTLKVFSSRVYWSPDGTKIARSNNSTIEIWDATTGHIVKTLEGHSNDVLSVSWNHDGSKIASRSWDNTIKLWDATTGQILHTLKGQSGEVNSVAWNPNGSKVASGLNDNIVAIWEAIKVQPADD